MKLNYLYPDISPSSTKKMIKTILNIQKELIPANVILFNPKKSQIFYPGKMFHDKFKRYKRKKSIDYINYYNKKFNMNH